MAQRVQDDGARGHHGSRSSDYLAKLEERGGIVEERIVGDELRSPSVQLRVTPLGEVELLSTHDQLLGGPSGQSYLGCRFPADPGYAAPDHARTPSGSASCLRRRACSAASPSTSWSCARGEQWAADAIEVNLRKGGTTHPFLTLQFLTDGRYDAARRPVPHPGRRGAPPRRHRPPRATPACAGCGSRTSSTSWRGTGCTSTRPGRPGVVFHMISAITDLGRVGMTAIGATPAAAQELYDSAEAALLDEARQAATPPSLPA